MAALEDLWRDVVYGCRDLDHHRGFAAVAVLTLGLGIGISSMLHGVTPLDAATYVDPMLALRCE